MANKNSSEDYAPVNQFGGNKQVRAAMFFPGKQISKEEFSKDFAELENATKNLKSAGSGVMEEFRKTRRFASKTQGGPWHF